MKRLVLKSELFPGHYIPKFSCTQDKYRKVVKELSCDEYYCRTEDCKTCEFQAIFDKLGEYEKIGLSPTQVQNLVDHLQNDTKLDTSGVQRLLNTPVHKEEQPMRIDAKFEKVSFEQFKKDWEKSHLPQLHCEFLGILPEEKIREIYDRLELPERSTAGSAGYDFHIPADCILEDESSPNHMIQFPTGIRCKIPEGYFLMIVPRSGLGFKYGVRLINTCGVIDSDYYNADNEGHIAIKMVRDESSHETLILHSGDKIAQGILVPYGITSDDSSDIHRTGGFGSTGK